MAMMADKTFFSCKIILSKSCEGTESCSFIGFVEEKSFRIRVSCGPKSLLAWFRVKAMILEPIYRNSKAYSYN